MDKLQEWHYRDWLAIKTGGQIEVTDEYGRADIVTETEVIEVKIASEDWRRAGMQALDHVDGSNRPLIPRAHFIWSKTKSIRLQQKRKINAHYNRPLYSQLKITGSIEVSGIPIYNIGSEHFYSRNEISDRLAQIKNIFQLSGHISDESQRFLDSLYNQRVTLTSSNIYGSNGVLVSIGDIPAPADAIQKTVMRQNHAFICEGLIHA